MSESNDHRKKRVGRACDSCRMKKTKCDGLEPCSKCSQDNKLCTYSEKKKQHEKTYSSDYVELLESRIEILQSSLQKLIGKIANNEDVTRFVPSDAADLLSINKMTELLRNEALPTEESLKNSRINSGSPGSRGSSSTSALDSHITTSTEPSSPWSSGGEEDVKRIKTELTETPEEEFSDLIPLNDHDTRGRRALAATGIAQKINDTSIDSPLSTTFNTDEQSPASWGFVSPADLESPSSMHSLNDFFSGNDDSLSPSQQPHHINKGDYPRSMSKIHKAGSSQNRQTSPNGIHTQHKHTPYSHGKSRKERSHSSNKGSIRRSTEFSLNGNKSAAISMTTTSNPFSYGDVSHSHGPSALRMFDNASVDEDALFILKNGQQFVQMEELNANLDELWLGNLG